MNINSLENLKIDFNAGMLATQMNLKVTSNEIDKHCLVVINRYVCNTIHERK